ncbi:MAG: hypothetical protein FJX76_06470 [Armatimonadetes bacterium]|nr:hypothetical protein [Armatimonadota bacterium]
MVDLVWDDLLERFMFAQRSRLSDPTFERYARVTLLLRLYLRGNGHWTRTVPRGESFKRLAEDFHDKFMVERYHATRSILSMVKTVMRRLGRFVEELPRTVRPKAPPKKSAARRKVSPEVTDAVHLHRCLSEYLANVLQTETVRPARDNFTITRVEPGQLWLEGTSSGQMLGPVSVPEEVSDLCRVGWDIGCVVGRTFGGWRLMEVWSVST